MPKARNADADNRDDDLEVVQTEVSPEEAEAEDETVGRTDDADLDSDERDADDEDGEDGDEDGDDYQEIETPRRNPAKPASRLDKFEKRLARSERIQDELKSENRQLVESNQRLVQELQKNKVVDDLAQKRAEAEAKLTGLRAEIKAAKEAGETDREIDLIEKISDVKAELKKAEAMAESAASAAKTIAQQPQRFHRLAEQWKRRHQRYTTDKNFQTAINALDAAIANEGFDKNSDDYWRELDRRAAKLFPAEYKRPDGARRHPAREPDDGGQDRGQQRRGEEPTFRKRGKAFVLDARQMRIMRTVGLDPDDENDRKTFVRENLS